MLLARHFPIFSPIRAAQIYRFISYLPYTTKDTKHLILPVYYK